MPPEPVNDEHQREHHQRITSALEHVGIDPDFPDVLDDQERDRHRSDEFPSLDFRVKLRGPSAHLLDRYCLFLPRLLPPDPTEVALRALSRPVGVMFIRHDECPRKTVERGSV